jgi:hypothetical protein
VKKTKKSFSVSQFEAVLESKEKNCLCSAVIEKKRESRGSSLVVS